MLKSYASFLKFLGHKLQGCADKMLSQEALLLLPRALRSHESGARYRIISMMTFAR